MNLESAKALVLSQAVRTAAVETRFSLQDLAMASSLLQMVSNPQSHLYDPIGALVQVLLEEVARTTYACTTCKGYGKVRGEMTDAGSLHQPPEYATEVCEDCEGEGYVRRD